MVSGFFVDTAVYPGSDGQEKVIAVGEGTHAIVFKVSEPSGVSSLYGFRNEGNVQVFPNPVEGTVTIAANGKQIREVHLYSVTGTILKSYTSLQNNRFSFDYGFETGVYLLRIVTEDGKSTTQRLLKM